jgi:hypothetical protein
MSDPIDPKDSSILGPGSYGLAFGALSSLGAMGQFSGNLMGISARRAQAEDQIRALEMKKASTLGLAAAKSGASGVEGSSASTMDYLSGLGAEFDRSIVVAKNTAKSVEMAGKIGAISQLFGGMSSAFGGAAAANNWA